MLVEIPSSTRPIADVRCFMLLGVTLRLIVDKPLEGRSAGLLVLAAAQSLSNVHVRDHRACFLPLS